MDVLTTDLHHVNALVIRRVLERIAAPSDLTPSPQPSSPKGEEARGGLTLPQLLDLVERAARGDAEVSGQLYPAMDEMARTSPDPTLRALGNVLRGILEGERAPDLDDLPPELASAVRGLLARLKHE